MLKNLTGGAVINYGPTMPANATELDGAIYQLTATDGQYLPGLYIFSSDPNQVTQLWREIFAPGDYVSKRGDRLSGPLVITTSNANTGFGQGEDSLTFNNTANSPGARSGALRWTNNWVAGTTPSPNAQIDTIVGAGNKATLVFSTTASNGPLTERMRIDETGIQFGSGKVWTSSNMGSGSGLDADLLDGFDSTYFLDASHLSAGKIPQARLTYQYQPVEQGGGPNQSTNKINIGWSSASRLRLSIDATDFNDTWPININGNAVQATSSVLAIKSSQLANGGGNGNAMTFNYNAQPGQPAYVWGSNDSVGQNSYVWSPSNFAVASAASSTIATKANTLSSGGGNGTAMTFTFSDHGDVPAYLWGGSDGVSMYVVPPGRLSVGHASSADTVPWTGVSGRPQYVSEFINNSGYITTAANTFNSTQSFISNYNTGGGANAPLQAASDGGAGAVMGFHRHGNYALNMGLDSDNVFRIGGWSAPANLMQLDMGGNVTFLGNVTAYSDRRLKKNIQPIEGALCKVEKLTGVTYNRIDNGSRGTGLIAQDVMEVLPEAVMDNPYDEYMAVAYGNMTGLLVESIKELSAQVKALQAEVMELRSGK
jgi:hypothetical protein